MRILVIDDEPAMHVAYRKTFEARLAEYDRTDLAAMAADLFGSEDEASPLDEFPDIAAIELVHAEQGLDALRLVSQSIADGNRFQVAFVDIRMPPGIDGKETAKRIREMDSEINLVVVTGYSDHTALSIAKVAGPIDKLFYISKPFDPEEVVHTARALGQRWYNDQELARTRAELANKVERLEKQSIELAANEARATHLAHHDPLTGSPNRLAFLRTLNDALNHREPLVSVAIVDLDRFKNINDTLGHFAGDELIRQICQKMTSVLAGQGCVARLGGDEFAISLTGVEKERVAKICDDVIDACSSDFVIFGHHVKVGASIGLVNADTKDAVDPIDLLRLADIALYDAKRKGGAQVREFDASMDESVRFRQAVEAGLRKAVSNDELELLFQPIVDRDNSAVAGFEALLRWTSPEHGIISPAVFIPVAEESNLIHEIGDWVTEKALQASSYFPDQYISINFSPRQFRRSDFTNRLIEQAVRNNVPARRIQIEITETAIFDDHDHAAETLKQLREIGFLVALDDFGTGYSSLFNIRNFALDCIKVDKSFVDSMGREHQSAAIINSVSHLARSLGLRVVAEGVETELQFQALRLAGCTHMQGYMFSQPQRLAEAVEFVAQYQVPGSAALLQRIAR
jgi:diguanylate cyclase (GGDEF)-like protein